MGGWERGKMGKRENGRDGELGPACKMKNNKIIINYCNKHQNKC